MPALHVRDSWPPAPVSGGLYRWWHPAPRREVASCPQRARGFAEGAMPGARHLWSVRVSASIRRVRGECLVPL